MLAGRQASPQNPCQSECRRRDSNPRYADYDSGVTQRVSSICREFVSLSCAEFASISCVRCTVACEVVTAYLEGDYAEVEGMCATCSRCGYETESFGTTEASIRRCLALLREGCPNREWNYYVDTEEEDVRAA